MRSLLMNRGLEKPLLRLGEQGGNARSAVPHPMA